MRKLKIPSYKTFGVTYMLLLALVLTIVIHISAKPGFVFGVAAILIGLVLIDRSFQASTQMLLVHAAVFIVVELVACIIILVNHGRTDLWFASLYTIFAIALVVERILKKMPRRYR